MKFPFDDDFEIFENECGRKQPKFGGISPKMLGLFMEDERNRESKVAPDTSGVDKYFIDG